MIQIYHHKNSIFKILRDLPFNTYFSVFVIILRLFYIMCKMFHSIAFGHI